MHFFPQKSWRSFLVVALKTQRPPTPLRLFHCQNKTNKAVSGQIWSIFLFSVHTITEAKQSIRQGGARSFDLARPGVAPPLVFGRTWKIVCYEWRKLNISTSTPGFARRIYLFIHLFIHYATEAAHITLQTYKIKHKVKTQSIKNSKNTTQQKNQIQI